eukprot:13201642-Alexandrium_andersonii.AAC.1
MCIRDSCRPGHLLVTWVPDKIERTVRLMEQLISNIAPIGERAVIQSSDSVPTRMFRLAGLFREYGV